MTFYPAVEKFLCNNIDVLDRSLDEFITLWLSTRPDAYETEQLLTVLTDSGIPIPLHSISNSFTLLKNLFAKRADEYLYSKSVKVTQLKNKFKITFKNYVGSAKWIDINKSNMTEHHQRMAEQVQSVTTICDELSWDYILNDATFKEETKTSGSTYVYMIQSLIIG